MKLKAWLREKKGMTYSEYRELPDIERYSLYLCLYYVYLEVLWTCFSDKQSFLLCLYIYMDVF